ncbi:amidohydrolase family protein [Haloarcula montana]|uniref:amidohydrolase family protein n=1 Tax=Haloarcula montana TaxID=3111776 RepID=UPI002D79322D|nr:amidohydrolase family protein [Haloarcula sp. GH36]
MTVDFGAHLFPRETYPDAFVGTDIESLLGNRLSDADELLEIYERAGIDQAVLSQPYFMGSGDAAETAASNDALLDVVADTDRLHGLAAIPTQAGGEAAAAELERALDAGFNGGALETTSGGIGLDDEELAPVFEVADRTGAPLLVHPKLDESLHPDALNDDYLLNATFGREAALAASISHVIHTGVLDRFPGLQLVYHHLGGNIATMVGRIRLQLDEGRWPGQDRVKTIEEFEAQLRERIYVDTAGFFGDRMALEAALDLFPASNVLFGTDYPYEPRSARELSELVMSVSDVTTTDQEAAVLAENARALLVNT